jgi:hypothetical protein
MPASIYSMAPAKFGATTVPVERIGFSAGVIVNPHQHSGNEYPTLVSIPGSSPRITLTVPWRAAYDTLGLVITELSAFELYLGKFAALIRSAGSVHTKWALTASCKAAAMITGASVNQDGILMAEVEIVPLSNTGMAHPLTRTDNNAMPTLASQPILHTSGPLSINGTVVPGVASYGLDLGQRLEAQRTDGALYPIVAARVDAAPKVTASHADPVGMYAQLGSLLGANISSNVVAYFRAYDATTGVVSAGADAVSITVASGRVTPLETAATQGQVATVGIEVQGLSSSATHPFAISNSATAPAIP